MKTICFPAAMMGEPLPPGFDNLKGPFVIPQTAKV